MIGGRRPLHGRKPGDRRVRVERPHSPYFRYTGPGQLTAKQAASIPATPAGRVWARVKAIALGRPLHSDEETGERLSKAKALAIFSSDAISSSAYATEEIILAFILAGAGGAAIGLSLPIAIAIAGLLALVAFSYRQVCLAYPSGGGSYSVSKANFGRMASLLAASALLIDYNLTAAVSTSSAVEQIASAVPSLSGDQTRVIIGVTALALITLANLRGLREAGNIFAVPTYLFLFSALTMIAIGLYRVVVLGEQGAPPPEVVAATNRTAQDVGAFVLLRAFASGAVALTGTEAIATGVPAFKKPESKNAATTLMVMAAILAVLFIGITFLATRFGIYPIDNPKQTVVAQVARTVYGDTIGFYAFQAFTALLLFLAANTSFAAFPRLAAVLAQDGFFPRQFSFRGDRLAFSMGIVLLGLIAASLVVAAGGHTHALIPLYAVGVFIDFTISQAGMIRHWLRTRPKGWQYRLAVNAVGCAATAVVAVVVTSVKFSAGAWLVVLLIPGLVASMLFIRRQYDAQARDLEVRDDLVFPGPHREQRVIIPVNGINRAVVQAVNFGRSLATDLRAVYVTEDTDDADRLRERWERQFPGVPLVIVESPYRALVGPIVAYLDVLDQAWPPDRDAPVTVVVLPEYVARHWWDRLLYNQTAKRLKAVLTGREHTVIADVPYRRGH
ncbi:MAG TPA: APC family permease [Candidatus Limnocylindrales bacterium]|nr:APC family permease [Candidatus Limnocylindrales bacterium]